MPKKARIERLEKLMGPQNEPSRCFFLVEGEDVPDEYSHERRDRLFTIVGVDPRPWPRLGDCSEGETEPSV